MKYVVKLGGAGLENPCCCKDACGDCRSGAGWQSGCRGAWRRHSVDQDARADGQEERVHLRPARHRCRDPRRRADGARRPREQRLVAALGSARPACVGLSGGDGHVFRARKKKTNPDLGFVGEIAASRSALARSHLEDGACPSSPPWRSASTASTTTSTPMRWPRPAPSPAKADALVFLYRRARRQRRGRQVMRWLSSIRLPRWRRAQVVSGGMLPKLNACREALLHGVKRVRILPAEAAKVLPDLMHFARQRWHGSDGRMNERNRQNLEAIQAAEAKLLLRPTNAIPCSSSRRRRAPARREGQRLSRPAQRHRRLRAGLRPSGDRRSHRAQSRALIHTSNLFFHEGRPSSRCASPRSAASTASSSATPAPKPGRPR
jgi:acetylglutamate kinase